MFKNEFYKECAELLKNAGIPDYEFDTFCIFQNTLGKKLLLNPNGIISVDKKKRIQNLINRRIDGTPLQYLLENWEFWGYTMKVGNGVFIPRSDTETLMDNVLEICHKIDLNSIKIVDLCSGSGCLAISLKKELPAADVTAVEFSKNALKYLKENAKLNSADINIVAANVLSLETATQFHELDIIVSNPPYLTINEMNNLQIEITHEPKIALYGGTDGLDFYRTITTIWRNSLKTGSWLCYEFGIGQQKEIEKILNKNGFKNIKFTNDAGGIIRTVTSQKSE